MISREASGQIPGVLGEPVDWTPVQAPRGIELRGASVRLVSVDPARHAEPLFAAAQGPGSDSRLWDYLFVGPFSDEGALKAWLQAVAGSDDPIFYTVIDEVSGRPVGMVSYLRITPVHGVIEIGNIWFGHPIQRTRQATEVIYLLARHAFDDLGYRRLEWKCDSLNARSRRAAERLGFTYEGVFRQHMVVKGRNRDTAWYAMLDRDWPAIREAFERWLAAENFDGEGRQRRSLTEIRHSIIGAGTSAAEQHAS